MDILIETERFIIRPLQDGDAAGMFAMDSDPEVHRYVGGKPVETIEQTKAVIAFVRSQYAEYGIGRWAVIEKATGEFAGWTGFKYYNAEVNGHINHYDFGYRFAQRCWGKGYATESGRAALQYGLQTLQLRNVYAMTDVDNAASRRILEKLGFRFDGIFAYNAQPDWREAGEPTTWYALPESLG